MVKIAPLVSTTFGFAAALLILVPSVWADGKSCGTVHKQVGEQNNGAPRFWPIAEYGGRAFIDMQTCLVARIEVFDKPPLTLSDAMLRCATLGQGGPYGEMGWQLPTMAELTSLDSDEWTKQRDSFGRYEIPPLTRTETEFWTSTPWPGLAGSWAVVAFSSRTTLVRPLGEGMKAGVWCVRGAAATNLE
jgi:hypothetical protein